MTTDEFVYDLLSNDATFQASYSSVGIYTGTIAETVPNPCILLTEAGQRPTHTKDSGDYVHIDYEIDVFGTTNKEAKQIAEAVRVAMDGHTSTEDTFRVEAVKFDGQEFRRYGADKKVYHVAQGYNIIIVRL